MCHVVRHAAQAHQAQEAAPEGSQPAAANDHGVGLLCSSVVGDGAAHVAGCRRVRGVGRGWGWSAGGVGWEGSGAATAWVGRCGWRRVSGDARLKRPCCGGRARCRFCKSSRAAGSGQGPTPALPRPRPPVHSQVAVLEGSGTIFTAAGFTPCSASTVSRSLARKARLVSRVALSTSACRWQQRANGGAACGGAAGGLHPLVVGAAPGTWRLKAPSGCEGLHTG